MNGAAKVTLIAMVLALLVLACTSGVTSTPPSANSEEYLDRVRQMYKENRTQIKHLTSVTFAPPTPRSSNDPTEPTSTSEEDKRYSLSILAPGLAELSRTSRFLRGQLDELNTMQVPNEHKELHIDLIAMWEAGIAWVDNWLESTQDSVTYMWAEDWEAFDAIDRSSNEDTARLHTLIDQHVNSVRRVDFVLFGTPESTPFDISGTSTAWAQTPLPPEPTAPLGPTPTQTTEPERLEITRVYEVRRLKPDEQLGQEEVTYIHLRAWERVAGLNLAAQSCNLYLTSFDTRPVDTPEVRTLWNQMTSDFARYELTGVVFRQTTRDLRVDINFRLSDEVWESIRPLFVEFVIVEQEMADSVGRLLDQLECPYQDFLRD